MKHDPTNGLLVVLLILSIVLPAGSARAQEEGETDPDLATTLAKLLDFDSNGRVTDSEVRRVFGRIQTLVKTKRDTVGGVATQALRDNFVDKESSRLDLVRLRPAIAQARLATDPLAQRAVDAFTSVDKDQNGEVSGEELKSFLEGLGQVGVAIQPSMNRLFRSIDVDRNRLVTQPEAVLRADEFLRFGLMVTNAPASEAPTWLRVVNIVSRLDADLDDAVSATEAARVRSITNAFQAISRQGNQFSAPELFNYVKGQMGAIARETARGKT